MRLKATTTNATRPQGADRCPFLTIAAFMGGPSLVRCYEAVGHAGPHWVSAGGCVPPFSTSVPLDTPSMSGKEGDSLWPWDAPGQSPERGPGEEPDLPVLAGVGEPCPTCGETDGGVLAVKRGRFGPFVGCNRYPDCAYIKKDGPPPPEQLPFTVGCPRCGEGHLVARRARRTGSVFWGCSRYPKCDFTTSHEPLGPVHDADQGPVARRDDESGICLKCGAGVALPAGRLPDPGAPLAGGPPDPAALARLGGRGVNRPNLSAT